MDIHDINKSIDTIDTHFRGQFNNGTEYERMLSRAVKLNEEVGELCEAVLHEGNEQRKDKTGIDFGSEVADVIICTLMLAKMKDISVWDEVGRKLEKIKAQQNISDAT